MLVTTGLSILKYILVQLSLPLFPAVFQDILAAIGRRSIEIYLVSSLTETMLMHGGHKSIWFRTMAHLEPYLGRSAADLGMSAVFTACVGAFALFLVRKQIKLF